MMDSINPNDILFDGRRIGDMQRDELVLVVAALDRTIADLATSIAAGHPLPIERNQVLVNPMMPGEHSILETVAGAGDMVENMGPPVVIAPYKPPKDKRVQKVLRAAEAERKADADRAEPRQIFRDPRLDPKYRPPKK
jgi:hypothetical protein